MWIISPARARSESLFIPAAVTVMLLATAVAEAQVKVFMIAGSSADHTPSSRASRPVIEKMGTELGLSVDYTEDLALFTEANLAKYQVFLQMNLYPFSMNTSHKAAMEKFMAMPGRSWVGIHAAGCMRTDWAFGVKLLGGVSWVSHPAQQNATFLIEDTQHPITAGVAPSFRIRDEWYEFSGNPRPNVHVLGKVDESTYTQNRSQGDHPLIWTNPLFDRAVYISVGHDPADWSHAEYLKIVRNALAWAKPVSTRLDPSGAAKGYLGTPRSARVWVKEGVLNLGGTENPGTAARPTLAGRDGLRILDANGRDFRSTPEGGSRYRMLDMAADGWYFLADPGR